MRDSTIGARLDAIDRVQLAHLPTPLQSVPRLARVAGLPELLVKRDDTTGLALGGAKARKLEYELAHVVRDGVDVIVTIGGAQSNHAVMTAAAARRLGVDVKLVLGGPDFSEYRGNMLLDVMLGAELRYLVDDDDNDHLAAAMDAWVAELRREGRRPYALPIGGSSGAGALGYVRAARELAEQVGAAPLQIVVAVGSCGTLAGLLLGAALFLPDARVIGISVSRRTDAIVRRTMELVLESAALLAIDVPFDESAVVCHDEYAGEYGVATTGALEAIRVAAESEGLLLDPVYTGKTLAGLLDLARRGRLDAGRRTVFIHTGGAPIAFAFTDQLAAQARCARIPGGAVMRPVTGCALSIALWLVPFAAHSASAVPASAPPNGQADIAAFVRALADSDPAARERAAESLGQLGPAATGAVDALIAAFAEDDPYLAGKAATALGRIGGAAAGPLGRALADPKPRVRMSAAIALGRIGSEAKDAAPALVHALGDADDDVRACAAVALGAIGASAREAAPALTERLSDKAEGVRRAARFALRRIAPEDRARALQPAALAATLERLTPQLMDELHVPGASIAVIRDRKLAWSRSFGVTDAGAKTPVTRDTLFEAASMSKAAFAVLVLQLADAKRFDLDRPLTAYWAGGRYPDAPEQKLVTARRVLSHTSGLPNWRDGGEEREGPLLFLFEPGSRFGYSGEGVYWLQQVVEHVTGQGLAQHARSALFTPLGMERTSFAWTPAVGQALATGHDAEGRPLPKQPYTHANAAYTMYTTAEEYARLLIEMMSAERRGTPVLSRRAARAMLAHEVRLDARDPVERPGLAEGLAAYWGLGWAINTTAAGDIVHHSGSNQTGFRCFSQFSPSRGSGLVVMTNGVGGSELWQRLVAAVGDL